MANCDATSGMDPNNKIDIVTLMESCRICMARNKNMSAIFDTNSENVIQEILFCTGVALRKVDKLPTKICMQCLKDLSVACKFKTSCLLAEETFHKLMIDANIKTERKEASDGEHGEYVDDIVENYNEKVKNEPLLEGFLRNTTNEKNESEITLSAKQSIPKKTPGRQKKSNAPRRMRKYKFKKLHCESCDIKFDNKQQCDQHKKELHKDSQHWVCEICGKLFIHRASHYTHIKSHMPPKYACDHCHYMTWHKYDLVKHIRRHTGIKMYQCEYCTASYYTSSNLTSHIRRNHMKEKPFQCNLCHLSFFDKTKLNRHIDSHNEIKRFECEVCHACFTRRCYWKKHLLRQHDIITPPQRPGRQKINAVVGEYLLEKMDSQLPPSMKNIESHRSGHQKVDAAGSEDLLQKMDMFIRPALKVDTVAEYFIQKADKEL